MQIWRTNYQGVLRLHTINKCKLCGGTPTFVEVPEIGGHHGIPPETYIECTNCKTRTKAISEVMGHNVSEIINIWNGGTKVGENKTDG